MTRTGRTLQEYMDMGVGGRLALISFINNRPADGALTLAMNPKDEYASWFTTAKTNAILADIYDIYSQVHTKKGRQALLYPRPQQRQGIGRGAIPVSEFWDWWNGDKANGS